MYIEKKMDVILIVKWCDMNIMCPAISISIILWPITVLVKLKWAPIPRPPPIPQKRKVTLFFYVEFDNTQCWLIMFKKGL